MPKNTSGTPTRSNDSATRAPTALRVAWSFGSSRGHPTIRALAVAPIGPQSACGLRGLVCAPSRWVGSGRSRGPSVTLQTPANGIVHPEPFGLWSPWASQAYQAPQLHAFCGLAQLELIGTTPARHTHPL
jgi:hypothetical protein